MNNRSHSNPRDRDNDRNQYSRRQYDREDQYRNQERDFGHYAQDDNGRSHERNSGRFAQEDYGRNQDWDTGQNPQQNFGRNQDWNAGQYPQSNYGRHQERDTGRGFGSSSDQGRHTSPWNSTQWQNGYRPGPHSGKGPKGYQRSNERVKEEICDHLASHGDLDASEIEVDVKDGEVTLSGTVSTRDEKREAEYCAECVSGVRDVNNRLKVEASKGAQSGKAKDSDWGSQARESKSKSNT